MGMDLEIRGLHHITAITSDASAAVQFYTRILGLKLVKKTVNFDDPTAYHLYFGDEEGRPGTLLTFFDWGKGIGTGRLGRGVTQHLAFTTRDENALSKWKKRLEQYGVFVQGPFDRKSFESIYLQDPDGLILEIATRGTGKGYSDSAHPESLISQSKTRAAAALKLKEEIQPVSLDIRLEGLHHVTGIAAGSELGHEFYIDLLGLQRVETATPHTTTYGRDTGAPAAMISFLTVPGIAAGSVGIGTVHHIAFAVDNDEAQLRWRERLLQHGANVTRVLDRKYFKSIYFREPNGLLLEIATIPPGFMVDEPMEQLGTTLTLPEWLEYQRPIIESSLKPITS